MVCFGPFLSCVSNHVLVEQGDEELAEVDPRQQHGQSAHQFCKSWSSSTQYQLPC